MAYKLLSFFFVTVAQMDWEINSKLKITLAYPEWMKLSSTLCVGVLPLLAQLYFQLI